MSSPYIFRFVGDSLANITSGYIESASSALASALGPVALAGITLFVLIYGLMTIGGKIQAPITDFAGKAVKMIIIAGIALNGGIYMEWVVASINGIEQLLVSAMTINGSPTPPNIYQALDEAIGRGGDVAATAFDKAADKDFYDMGGIFFWTVCGVLIYTGLIAFFLIGGAYIVVVKFSLAIVLALGPIFVLSLLWSPTAGFFDRWIGQVVTYVLSVVIVTVVLSMGISIFDSLISGTAFTDDTNGAFISLQVLIVGAVLGFVTVSTGSLAAALGGGSGMGALSMRMLASVATGPAGMAKTIIQSAGQIANPTSHRLDPRTSLQTPSSRLEHFAQGRSFFSPNPAYRRAVTGRFKDAFRVGSNSVRKG